MTANTPSSRKAKGRKFQQFVRDQLREVYKESLSDGDLESRGMGQAGTDIVMSPLAKSVCPFDIEIKNQETWNVPKWWRQAVENTEKDRKTLLVMKKSHHKPLIVMDFDDFLELISKR